MSCSCKVPSFGLYLPYVDFVSGCEYAKTGLYIISSFCLILPDEKKKIVS